MKIHRSSFIMASLLIAFIGIIACTLTPENETLEQNLRTEFKNPPNSAKPRVWWHWMNGNVTKDGIKKDLEWMHRSGIGGFQNFDAALATPTIVEKRLTYMTPDWIDAFAYATKLADSMKLEMGIAGSPGWSESGGPWVKPADGMKKLVWSEVKVVGGIKNIVLPEPPQTTGPFQNIPKQPKFGIPADIESLPTYYQDVAVIAYKVNDNDKSMEELGVSVTSSGGNFSIQQLTDGDLTTSSLLPRDDSKKAAWIQFSFPKAVTIKSITMVGGGTPGTFGRGGDPVDSRTLEAGNDGKSFKTICTIPPGRMLQQTISIPVTTAKYFRIAIKNPPAQVNPFAMMTGGDATPFTPPGTEIAEIVLHTVDKINCFEEKDAFAPVGDLDQKITRATEDAIPNKDIIELTDRLNPNETLNWTAPDGQWKIIRFGYSLLGIENHPASEEATGLEVDKLDPIAVTDYLTNYLNQYKEATKGLMGENVGLQYIITDSWEAGAQNWTDNLPQEFESRRGYSMIPWMPAFTGQIISSSEATEKFLWDFRKTLSEMLAEYHYDKMTEILAQFGMKRYSESHEAFRAMVADGMDVKRSAAIPMSAMWTPNPMMNGNDQTGYISDIRESASVAHLYGQNLVAAESMTAFGIGGLAWSYCPENLKPTADLELANGLNRFVIHCSPHQPVDDKVPGLGLGPFGQWFTRHETWAEKSLVWTTYLARSSYMLQQGQAVADILYLYAEDNNITSLFFRKLPDIPKGYDYDFINVNALINLISVKDGQLYAPSGMKYSALVLDKSMKTMSLEVLQKIKELVEQGAIVIGDAPKRTPSLLDDETTYKKIVNSLFNGEKVHAKNIETVFSNLKITPDFINNVNGQELLYVHRKLENTDVYWLNNRADQSISTDVSFRISGKIPEIWHPETGEIEEVSYTMKDGYTNLKFEMVPNDAVFVVFEKSTELTTYNAPISTEDDLLKEITGPWDVIFQKDRGAPESAVFDKLISWTDSKVEGIKYFSGTASYKKSIEISSLELSDLSKIVIDLGDVKNIAEVFVNGKSAGIVWKTPFKVDITNLLKEGVNDLEIQVTNLWVNRLIGDEQPNVQEKITYTTMPFYNTNSPLLPSGLLGPVKLLKKRTQVFENNDLTITKLEEHTWVIETADNTTMYLLEGDEKAMLIDTGTKCENLDSVVHIVTPKPLTVVLTHIHPDHAGNIKYFDEIYYHPADSVLMGMFNFDFHGKANFIKDGDQFDLGNRPIDIKHMPGHTPGSVVLLDKNHSICYTGDAFGSEVVWLQLQPHLPIQTYINSCKKMEELMDDGITKIYYGHYPYIKHPFGKDYIKKMRTLAEKLLDGTAPKAQEFPVKIPEGAKDPMITTLDGVSIVFDPTNL